MKKMHELGRLIASIQERNDWSDRDLQLHAEQLGHSALSKPNFSRWRNSPVNSIKGSNIRDMAAVLGTSETVGAQAALDGIGIQARMPDGSSDDTALSLVRALLGAMGQPEERHGGGTATPMNQTDGDPADAPHYQKTPTASAAPAVGEQGGPSAGAADDRDGVDDVGRRRAARAAGGASVAADGSMSDEDFLRLQGVDSRVDWYSLTADDRPTEGMAHRDAIDAAGEESQVPDDDEDGGQA